MISYQKETYDEAIEDMKPLLELHYKEVCLYPDKLELNPSYGAYEEMDTNGSLRIITARDHDELIGYSVFFLYNHPHYQDHIYGQNDVLYVKEDHRHTDVAPLLVQKSEEHLIADGCSVILYHMKPYKTFESLMDYMAYGKAEYIFSKYVKDD